MAVTFGPIKPMAVMAPTTIKPQIRPHSRVSVPCSSARNARIALHINTSPFERWRLPWRGPHPWRSDKRRALECYCAPPRPLTQSQNVILMRDWGQNSELSAVIIVTDGRNLTYVKDGTQLQIIKQ